MPETVRRQYTITELRQDRPEHSCSRDGTASHKARFSVRADLIERSGAISPGATDYLCSDHVPDWVRWSL